MARARLSLFLLLLLTLVASGCYGNLYRSSRGDDDDDNSGDDDDAADGDDDDASDDDDDDDASDDDDDASDDDDDASDDDDDVTPPHDDDDATDDDDVGPDDDDVGPDDDDVGPDDDDASSSLPAFVDDCGGSNDTIETASGLDAIDGETWTNVEMCAGEIDYYVTIVPGYSTLSVQILIDGTGQGSTDLDLYEVDTDGTTALQASYSEQDYERLAVHNAGSSEEYFYWAVQPYSSAVADYDIVVETSDYHEVMDCDSVYSDTSESGPCNQILQYPRNPSDDDGYLVEHQAHYSNLRRELHYLVSYAAEATMDQFPGTTVLSLMDMSEDDGSTPGAMVSSLRHPAGTHIDGNDLDIAYYQNDGENNGQIVCPSNDGQFCTGPPTLLDAERTAFFMAKLLENPNIRVIGVDVMIGPEIEAAADALEASGVISSSLRNQFDYDVTWGSGWPFHHHHMHVSWDWEDGWWADGDGPIGCMLEPSLVELPGKTPAWPMATTW